MSTNLEKLERKILDFLKSNGPTCRRTIAESLRMETASVAGRVNSLMCKWAVSQIGWMFDPRTGKTVQKVRACVAKRIKGRWHG